MQSPIRALLYGIAIWFVWVTLVVFSAQLLPTEIGGSALFVSMQMVVLAALVLGFTILYLRKVGDGSFKEGLLVGLDWVVVMIAIDLAHSVLMPGMVPDIGAHDGALLTINFAFLMWVVLVPFSTSMVMEYGDSRLVWDVYVSHLLLTGLTLSWLWHYASKGERLIEPDADLDKPGRYGRQEWGIRAVFLLSIAISFLSVDYAQWFLLLLLPLPALAWPLRRRLAGRRR